MQGKIIFGYASICFKCIILFSIQEKLHFLSRFLETVVVGIIEYEFKILQNLIMFPVTVTYNVNVWQI
jgi:hypothetical protein